MWGLFNEIVCTDNDSISRKRQSQRCTKKRVSTVVAKGVITL